MRVESEIQNPQSKIKKAGHRTSAPDAVERVLTRFLICASEASSVHRFGGEARIGEDFIIARAKVIRRCVQWPMRPSGVSSFRSMNLHTPCHFEIELESASFVQIGHHQEADHTSLSQIDRHSVSRTFVLTDLEISLGFLRL